MGKPRVRGSHAKIFIKNGTEKLAIGEVNKFSVKELGELKKSRAIGEHTVTSIKTFEGYDLSFEGGKVDWELARLLHAQDYNIVRNKRTPYFQVEQTISYFTGEPETYTYDEVTIYGYNMDIDANDEITEKFEGFCGVPRTLTGFQETEPSGKTIEGLITEALKKDSLPK